MLNALKKRRNEADNELFVEAEGDNDLGLRKNLCNNNEKIIVQVSNQLTFPYNAISLNFELNSDKRNEDFDARLLNKNRWFTLLVNFL